MLKKIAIIPLCLLLVLTLTACTGSERLKNMTIVQGFSIDSKNGRTSVTIQYLDLNKGGSKIDGISGSIVSFVEGEGKDIRTAVNDAGEKLPDALFFGQNKIIAVSDEYEKQYSRQLKAYLIKNKESRPDVLILKSKGEAAKIIKDAQKNTIVPADSVYKQLKKLHRCVTVSDYLAGDELLYYRPSD